MKKLFTILLLSATLIACNEEQKGEDFVINGTMDNVPDGTNLYVIELDENNQPKPLDTTQIQEGKFELDMPEVENPRLNFLSIDGVEGNVVFIAENEKINIEVYKDSLRSSVINGGTENQLLSQYIQHLKESNQRLVESRMAMQEAVRAQDTEQFETLSVAQEEVNENDKRFKKKFVEEHPEHLVSALALTDMISMQLYPTAEIKKMYDNLSQDVKNSRVGKSLGENLQKMSAVDVGAKAPNFSAPTPNGEMLSLEEAMGKVTIVDFWASWCKPCRIENPNVVRIYNKYHDQGLNIIGVSLDRPNQKNKWLEAIEDDQLTWHHVSNLKFWQEPIAQTYGVRAIPATFILDENGVIVAKDLKGDKLEEKIASMLDE